MVDRAGDAARTAVGARSATADRGAAVGVQCDRSPLGGAARVVVGDRQRPVGRVDRRAPSVPAITANSAPSRMQSIAAQVASLAASMFRPGTAIDPDVSTITITADRTGRSTARRLPVAVTVTIALTSVAPSGEVLVLVGLRRRRWSSVDHHRRDVVVAAALERDLGERARDGRRRCLGRQVLEQARERARGSRCSSRRRRCRGSAGRARPLGAATNPGGPSGASAPSQRVIACARLSRAASSALKWPAATCSPAQESSSVSWRASPGAIQYARLSPSQPIATSSVAADRAHQRAGGHRDVGAARRRRDLADGGVRRRDRRGAGRLEVVRAAADGVRERRARDVRRGPRRDVAGRRGRDPVADDGDDRVPDELEVEGVLVAVVHAALVADRGRGAEVELDPAFGNVLLLGRGIANPGAALLAEVVARDEQRVACVAARAHVHVLGRTSLAKSTRRTRSSSSSA